MNINSSTMKANEKARILVVEDEVDLREATVAYLQLDGMAAVGVGTLQAARSLLARHSFDLLVLDLGLPDGDARVWLEQNADLRDKGIIVTTARGERTDRIQGVQAGADCYLVKPVDLDELVGLARNLLRRLRTADQPTGWILDTLKWTMQSPEARSLKLTHSELVLMQALARRPGESVSRDELAIALGHDPLVYDPRRLEVLVRRLRNKVAERLGYPLPLETVHGQGYAFVAPMTVNDSG
jgi:two-component system, OmpR family, response regulator